MSAFFDRLEEYLGDSEARGDIRAIVRRCWFYDIPAAPIRMWDGQGRLHTSDGNVWLGSIDGKGHNYHKTPRLADGRDGSSVTYPFTLGYVDKDTYEAVKADQSIVDGATLTCYRAIFSLTEGLRPQTPIQFAKELTLFGASFDEELVLDGFSLIRRYSVGVQAKDGNYGRSEAPSRTYSDTQQKQYAASLGVANDRGCEFVAGLANRTYRVP